MAANLPKIFEMPSNPAPAGDLLALWEELCAQTVWETLPYKVETDT